MMVTLNLSFAVDANTVYVLSSSIYSLQEIQPVGFLIAQCIVQTSRHIFCVL